MPGTPGRRPSGVLDTEQEVGVATPRAIEEGRLIDDVGALGHRVDRCRRGRAELVPAIHDRSVEVDLDRRPALGLEGREESRLVLKAASAEDVQLRIVAHRPPHQPGEGRPFELGQVLAGQEGDEVGGGVDGPALDQLHSETIPGTRASSPVTAGLSRWNDDGGVGTCAPRSRPLVRRRCIRGATTYARIESWN